MRRRPTTGQGSGADLAPDRQRARRSAAITVVISVAGLLGGVAAATGAVVARGDARDAQAAADLTEIISVRFDLRDVHVREANTLMRQVFGAASRREVDDVRVQRREVRAASAAVLERIAEGQGPAALEARALLEMLDADGFDETVAAPPLKLLDTAWNAAFAHRPPTSALGDELLALDDLMLTGITAQGILSDGLDAAYVLEQPDVDEFMAPYVAESEPYLEGDGGYLGPDRDDPLRDAYVFDDRAAAEHPALAEVRRLVVDSDLWRFDQWIRSWQQARPQDPPPFGLDELIARTTELDTRTTGLIEQALADELDVRRTDASAADARSLVLLGAAALLLLIPLGLLAGAVRRRFRSVTSAAAQVSIDPLTGVGNRNHLRAETETKVSDAAHRWHLAAAIDMDRFKLINDTWGHAVGDRVLVEVAQRLTDIVDDWRGSVPGASGTVVRLGGDEFLLTLHASAPINIDAVRTQLDEVRATWISVSALGGAGSGTGEQATDRVQLAFSVGLATAHAPVALDDLMHLADLASYEEKAIRSGADPRRRRPDVTGTTGATRAADVATDRSRAASAGDDA